MNRRNILVTSAIVAPAIALAACSTPNNPNATEAGINRAINVATSVLSYLGPVVPMVAAFVPGAAIYVAPAEAGITLATSLLNTLQTTMSAADAQPIIGKITTAIGGVLNAADQAVALIPAGKQHDQAAAILAAARGELPILSQLAVNIQGAVTQPPKAQPPRPGVVVPRVVVRK